MAANGSNFVQFWRKMNWNFNGSSNFCLKWRQMVQISSNFDPKWIEIGRLSQMSTKNINNQSQNFESINSNSNCQLKLQWISTNDNSIWINKLEMRTLRSNIESDGGKPWKFERFTQLQCGGNWTNEINGREMDTQIQISRAHFNISFELKRREVDRGEAQFEKCCNVDWARIGTRDAQSRDFAMPPTHPDTRSIPSVSNWHHPNQTNGSNPFECGGQWNNQTIGNETNIGIPSPDQ